MTFDTLSPLRQCPAALGHGAELFYTEKRNMTIRDGARRSRKIGASIAEALLRLGLQRQRFKGRLSFRVILFGKLPEGLKRFFTAMLRGVLI